MTTRPRLALALAGVVALAGLACDAHKGEAEAPDEKVGVRPDEAFASPPPRDLATLQRELAKQESELRRLGVLVDEDGAAFESEAEPQEESTAELAPGRGGGGADTTTATKATDKGKQGGKQAEKKKSPTKTTSAAKDAKVGGVPGSAPRPAMDDGDAATQPDPTTSIDEAIGDSVQPEAAKAVQAPPRDRPTEQQDQLRAEDRCPLICSLAENTCELAEEICSLAERHGDDSEYSGACERASDDCKQAQEACLECHG